jgi:aerobic-type carbon monoxide dehydrogenase small subunit (CoxS/CutS family)
LLYTAIDTYFSGVIKRKCLVLLANNKPLSMSEFQLTINGKKETVTVAANTPLLWVLRDHIQLTGTKFGCGIGQCGACTIHLDGVAMRSCSLPISAVGDQKITTIEGLSAKSDHPLQKAWIEHDVPQCGYCQSGQIMNAASLLADNPNPSDEDIAASMNGNICRCGTYVRIHAAIKTAAKQMS